MSKARPASRFIAAAAALLCSAATLAAGGGQAAALLERIDSFAHAETVDREQRQVLDYVVGLGPMQKVRGDWRLESSERVSGTLQRYTWRIVDGFSAIRLFEDAVAAAAEIAGSELLFACEARACGRSVQWANRVFGQRVLYGTEQSQRYSVYAFRGDAGEQRLVLYASARTSDRQYLHMELLTLRPREDVMNGAG